MPKKIATIKAPKSPAKIPAVKKPAAKAKKVAKVAPKLPFYSTAGRVLTAAAGRKLARGTYAHLGADMAQSLRDAKVRIGTAKGTVFEGSALDFLKGVLADRGIKLDVNGENLPAIGVSAAS